MGKIMRKRWAIVILALAMVIGLVPPMPAPVQAAPVIQILDLSATPDLNTITRVTTGMINVRVNVTGIDPTEYTNLYYEITNLTSGGAPLVDKNNKAMGSGQNEVTFYNVQLTEGVNQIVVKYGDTSSVSSSPAYVLYTPIAVITDLQIDGETFVDGGIYPKVPKQRFFITGKAPNATEVEFRLKGDPQPHYAFVSNGEFFIMVEDAGLTSGSQTNFKLRPGNNEIDIIARNPTNTYYAKRTFIYDNGYPFAYDVKLIETGSNKEHDLAFAPTVESQNLQVTGKLKVNLDTTSTPSVTEYVYGGIYPSTGADFEFSFDALPASTPQQEVKVDRVESNYIIYSFKHTFTINQSRNQSVTFAFEHRTQPARNVTASFNFFYQDPNAAYVDRVHMVLPDNSTGPQLSETGVNTITEYPSKLRVFVNANTNSIKAFLGENKDIELNVGTLVAGAERYFDVEIGSHIPDDTYKLTVEPYDASNNLNQEGVRTYQVQLLRVPYLVVSNLPNGQVMRSLDELMCTGGPNRCLEGRVVNTSFDDGAEVEISLDGTILNWPTSGSGTHPTTGTSFRYLFDSGLDPSDGRHVLTLKLYIKNRLITEKTIIFYIFKTEAPVFGDIGLWSISSGTTSVAGDDFLPGQLPDSYVTNESYVRLTGSVFNVDGASLSITVRTRDANGQPRIATDRFNDLDDTSDRDLVNTQNAAVNVLSSGAIVSVNEIWVESELTKIVNVGSDPYWEFGTYYIVLQSLGDTIIELSATNSTGTVTKTITITREPLPYRIIEPASLIKNANGVDQVNVNSNFLRVKLEAEGADRVEFGRNQLAVRDPNDPSGKTFVYEVKNLKKGANRIRFSVWRGTQRIDGEFIAFNINTPTTGATFKTKIDTRLEAFEDLVQIRFPRNTLLKRNDPDDPTPIISGDREILFGIAGTDGRVDRENYAPNLNTVVQGRFMLQPPSRYRLASPLLWIDAGSIRDRLPNESVQDYMQEALTGSGRDPYEGTVFYLRSENEQFVPTQRGTLTIKFDPSIRDNAWRYISVFMFDTYVDYRGVTVSGWRNLGGVVDTRNNTITVPFDKFGYYAVMYMNNSFNDVINHSWARDALDTMYSKGYMLNETTESFGPNSSITRGEFATMLVKIFDIPLQYDINNPSFTDVPPYDPTGSSMGLWEYKYIETAARVGIIRGTTFNRFAPTSTITRQDAAVMIARAAELRLESNENRALASLQKQFTDANLIDIYARAAVDAVVKKGFIEGKANTLQAGQTKPTYRFDPLETFTRAEAALVAMRVLQDLKKIPK
jgi:hypothetical protein